jgi:spore coat polysaccharide biosynthesis protein SpsF
VKRVAIVQARMTSTRLPGELHQHLAGRPLLAQMLDRLMRARTLDEIVLATTVNASDDPIVELAKARGIGHFRGSESDVLSRYAGAARAAKAELVVRVTSDCPLIDPDVLDEVVTRACDPAAPCDYASNTRVRSYPRGLDVEAFHVDVLERMERMARSAPAREHVTYFLHSERGDLFVLADIAQAQAKDDSDLRWTVDTPDDLELVRRIYAAAGLPDRWLSYADLVELVRADRELVTYNAHVAQKVL